MRKTATKSKVYQLERQLLFRVFQHHTRSDICLKLGKSKAFFTLWNRDKAHLDWSDFVKLVELLNLSLAKALYLSFKYEEQVDDPILILANLWPRQGLASEVRKRLGISMATAHRILARKQKLRLRQFLVLLESWRYLDAFIENLGLANFLSLPPLRYYETERNLLIQHYPEFGVIVNLDDIGAKISAERLSKVMGFSVEHIKDLRSKLVQIKKYPKLPSGKDELDRVFRPTDLNFNKKVVMNALEIFRNSIALDLVDPSKRIVFASSRNVSSEALKDIRKAIFDTYAQINIIVSNDQGKSKEHFLVWQSGCTELPLQD